MNLSHLLTCLAVVCAQPILAVERVPRASLEIAEGRVTALAFSPDGKTFACACAKEYLDPFGAVEIWDATTHERLSTLRDHAGGVTAIAVTKDGKFLASGSEDTTLKLRDLAGGNVSKTMKGALVPAPIRAIAVSPDGKLIASGDWILRLWDSASGQERGAFWWIDGVHGDQITAVTFSPDGRLLASAGWEGTVKLWDVSKASDSNDADDALARLRREREWNPKVANLQATLKGPIAQAWTLAFSPDGRLLAAGYEDGTINVWKTDTNQQKTSLHYAAAIKALSFAPDNQTLIAGRADGSIQQLKITEPQTDETWKAHESPVAALAVAPDGKTLLTGSGRKVEVWNLHFDR